MTNLEALRANISDAHGVVLTESHFVKALVDVGLNEVDTYTNRTAIDKATLILYDHIIAGANLSEGALSYSVNIDAVRRARDLLAEKLGEDSRKRNIDTVSIW